MPEQRQGAQKKINKLDNKTRQKLKQSLRKGYTEMADLNRELAE